jgi:hypothetical protein
MRNEKEYLIIEENYIPFFSQPQEMALQFHQQPEHSPHLYMSANR